MRKRDVINYFLEKKTLEGAPGVEVLGSIDDVQNGSVIYFPCIVNTELVTIRIKEMRHCLTHVVLDEGGFLSEGKSSSFGTSFPKEKGHLTMPERYLKIYPKDIAERGIYHTRPE
ncbi:hypothetical protein HOD05_00970 [Candidatus Woesearchaeota archaeon]|jgi:hypothetical protein|nr:hypothetical protein [Candidatus Woesearchaeota archaeon]MBT4150979.1 hypothetical protein [Candidatus Woesearchaeota archaeon]MBT4247257.1 hypothetical protein [Candidatus Woesearchaeota archaeon]MBT4433769.1 hypothetical protein [Candidatus Woesearchaeota archaeon]MBT7331898.1 hypothetical protein [Candidatus Woesearchaeota archaeon]